jgi:hypothetical protein
MPLKMMNGMKYSPEDRRIFRVRENSTSRKILQQIRSRKPDDWCIPCGKSNSNEKTPYNGFNDCYDKVDAVNTIGQSLLFNRGDR